MALADLGGRVAQGYLFSRPVPAAEAVAFMSARQAIADTLARLRPEGVRPDAPAPPLRVVRGGR
jgi:EAL domain-containing protein (putative c-di-GMP-specific phosphodiesterase class I)